MADFNIEKNMFMDRTSRLLSKVMDFRIIKQSVISGNLANVDTPGYVPKELPFEKALQNAVGKEKRKIYNPVPDSTPKSQRILDKNFDPREMIVENKDVGELDIDSEMAKMAQNNLLYEASVRLLSKKLEALKTVITEARR